MYDPLKKSLNGLEIFCFALTFVSNHPILKLGKLAMFLKNNQSISLIRDCKIRLAVRKLVYVRN